MNQSIKALKQLSKAQKLVNRAFHKNGPKSFKKGQGALLKVLNHSEGAMTSRELVDKLSFDRATLKSVVKKAKRNGYVTVSDCDEQRTYSVALTEEGKQLAQKRCKAQVETAEAILSCLTDEEVAQLDAITEKIIVSCKEQGAHGKRKNTKKCKRHGHGHGRKCHKR